MSNKNCKFQIECKQTKPGEEVYIVGNSNELGNWNVNNSKKLSTNSNLFPQWESNPISFNSQSQLEYKYIIKSSSNNVKWENFDGNRLLNLSNLKNNTSYIINDGKYSDKSRQKINESNEAFSNTSYNNEPKQNVPKKKGYKNHNKINNNNNNNNQMSPSIQASKDKEFNVMKNKTTMGNYNNQSFPMSSHYSKSQARYPVPENPFKSNK